MSGLATVTGVPVHSQHIDGITNTEASLISDSWCVTRISDTVVLPACGARFRGEREHSLFPLELPAQLEVTDSPPGATVAAHPQKL